MTRFVYSALRFVPDPMKGEFVNVGVIVGSDEEEQWAVRMIQRTGRATALTTAGSGAWPAVAAQIAELQASVDAFMLRSEGLRSGPPEHLISEKWLEQASSDHQNMLQFTKPMPVLNSSVEDAIDQLWTILIDEPDARKKTVTKSTIRSGMARKLRLMAQARGLHVATTTTLRTGDTHTDVDIVTHNGHAAHLTQCYSFDVADLATLVDSIKAWGWTVRDLREKGGTIQIKSHDVPVPNDVRVAVVYFAPDREESKQAFREAMTVFDDQEVKADAVDKENSAKVIQTASSLFEDHD